MPSLIVMKPGSVKASSKRTIVSSQKYEIHDFNGGRSDIRSISKSVVCISLLLQPQNHKWTEVMTCGEKKSKVQLVLTGQGDNI